MNSVGVQIGLSWRGSLIRQIEEEPDTDILPYPFTSHKFHWASILLDRDTGRHDLLGPVGGWREGLTSLQVDAQLQAWSIDPASGWV